MKKLTVLALVAVIAFSGCTAMFFSGSADAEAATEVTEIEDGVEIKLDGETKEVAAFEYLGIVYAVIDESEAAEKVGVYGLGEAFEGKYVCVNSFDVGEDDDAVHYSVTKVLSEFGDLESSISASDLILAESITEFGEGCFEKVTGTVTVAGPAEDASEADVKAYEEMMDDTDADDCQYEDELTAAKTLTMGIGDMNGNVKQNYNGDFKDDDYTYEVDIFNEITIELGCDFEYPGYDFASFSNDDADLEEGMQLYAISGSMYIDAEKYNSTDYDFEAQWEENQDFLAEFEFTIFGVTFTGTYQMWMMWATAIIIVVLAIIGLSMFGYRTMLARRA